jgi:hypothetical protein
MRQRQITRQLSPGLLPSTTTVEYKGQRYIAGGGACGLPLRRRAPAPFRWNKALTDLMLASSRAERLTTQLSSLALAGS